MRQHLTAANIMAALALFVALGGIGYAASVPSNSVGSAQLKANAVTSPKVAANTLTGADVKESTLAQVPNARMLDGMGSESFVKTQNLVHVWESMTMGDADKTLVTNGDISIKMRCWDNADTRTMNVYAATTADGALLKTETDTADPLNTDTEFSAAEIFTTLTGTGIDDGYDETGFVVNAAGTRSITLLEGSSFAYLNRFGKDCTYGGTYILESTV